MYNKSHFSAEYLHICKSDLGVWMFIRNTKVYLCKTVGNIIRFELTKNEKDGDVTC